MLSQKNNERIDAHLSGDDSPEDQQDFKRRIGEDPQLAGEVDLWQNIDEAITDEQTLAFQRVVAEAGKDYLQTAGQTPAKVRRLGVSRRFLSIAAAVLVLVASSVLIWQLNGETTMNGQELFAANYTPYELTPPTARSSEVTVQSKLDRGINQYQQKDFAAAATTLAALPPAYQDSMEVVFPLANAYLNQQPPKTALAEAQFQRVIDHGDNAHVHEAQWYLALINLQREDFSTAKVLLEAAGQVNDATGRRAMALLNELK